MRRLSGIVYGHSWPLLRKIPVLRFLVFFTGGILLSDNLQWCPGPRVAVTCLLVQLMIWCVLQFFLKSSYRRRYYFGALVSLLFFSQGLLLTFLRTELFYPGHFHHHRSAVTKFRALVAGTPRERTKSYRIPLRVNAVFRDGKWYQATGNVLCYLSGKHINLPVYGQTIFCEGKPELIREGEHPAAKLFKRRQISHRVFVRRYAVISGEEHWSGWKYAVQCRLAVTGIVMQQMKHSAEAAIAVALLVGEEISIDEEINNAYAATGTLHVLSVSGMHVGLIFLLLSVLLKPLLKWRAGVQVYYPLVLLLIWAYALVAGAAPSITRAALMCSFFLVSKWLDRKNQGFGALGAALFLILMVHPYALFEPGLQLSFFAVLGIIWLQRPLLRCWVPRNWLLFKAWELTSVSIAAQLTTLPVSLYYFGQFPNYFIPANLVVIPLTTACIYVLILQVCLSPLPMVAALIAQFSRWLLQLTNSIVLHMKDWPCAVSYWKADLTAAVFLFILLIETTAWLQRRRFMILLRIICWLILLTVIRIVQTI